MLSFAAATPNETRLLEAFLAWLNNLTIPSLMLALVSFAFVVCIVFVVLIGGKIKFFPPEIESNGLADFVKKLPEAKKVEIETKIRN